MVDSPSPLIGNIEFIDYHKPGLLTGDYTITVTQKVSTGKDPFKSEKNFSVAGPRFALAPQDIAELFPPPGYVGNASNVLPHVILNRTTLPWERDIWFDNNKSSNHPWLALLVFHEEEITSGKVLPPQTLTLKELIGETPADQVWYRVAFDWLEKHVEGIEESDRPILLDALRSLSSQSFSSENDWNQAIKRVCADNQNYENLIRERAQIRSWFPETRKETAQSDKDKVVVIDVQRKLLDTILPTPDDLQYLAHVRRRQASDVITESAVVVANRLPKAKGLTTIYLISIENRYDETSKRFNYPNDSQEQDFVRLITLKSWSFSCSNPEHNLKDLLKSLNQETLKLPLVPLVFWWKWYCKIQIDRPLRAEVLDLWFISLAYRLRFNALASYLETGCVPLRHYMRRGDKVLSWYRSPLIPYQNTEKLDTQPRVADQLLRYDPKTGLFDTTYAAAWTLGRMLAVQDKNFSVALFNWKRTCAQATQKSEQAKENLHLYFEEHTDLIAQAVQPPENVDSWFKQKSLLKGLPFNYLIPDPRLLPEESIRFFWVDPLWVTCLLDGALSLGRVTVVDSKQDQQHTISQNRYSQVTGILLRSEAVSGWPGLMVDAYQDIQPLSCLRMERLAKDVLLCLFDGQLQQLKIHLKPEALHFGFKESRAASTVKFSKELKNPDTGEELTDSKVIPISSNGTQESLLKNNSVVEINTLATKMGCNNSSQFALQMIEGGELVSFEIK